ncbi:murein L,D-transpeptidase catalytic domain family protein [Sphingosinicella microcystinivorans]|uniref:murein L,D-transpeptidase catalytic domain family protein n=1 Tax=Sphingosinicella microcystinivorans TaxID=335406 RepID=UPI0022F39359|nr:murein L,D-transpeptidase catalytic domain family protein [Sphingosinicella microcystinivorans]WBX85292.1 murein L,D-transpeptidase catalytic domain family protein [Sphingosinicella microcystinivorans]
MIGILTFALLAAPAPKAVTLDADVRRAALDVVSCAQASGIGKDARSVTIIDYGRTSLEPRLWVVDLKTGAALVQEYVAHGRNSGDNRTTSFSNAMNSHQSSLGLFVTAETYMGSNGYSLRMDGLVPGINDAARARAIVMHGAPYVNPDAGAKQGRLGRSWGCPALRSAVARGVIDLIKGGNFVFAWHPDKDWVGTSPYGKCVVAMQDRPAGASRTAR